MKSLVAVSNCNENVIPINNNCKSNGNETASIDLVTNPCFKIAEALEKKLRNLEKRRTKLQQIKLDFENGTKLSEEQLEAISKTGEVESQIEYFKDTIKLVAQQQKQYLRDKKKHLDAQEKINRNAEIKSLNCILQYQEVLKFFGETNFKKKLMQDLELNFSTTVLDSLQKVYDETTISIEQCKSFDVWEEQTERVAKIFKQIDFEHREVVAGGLTGFCLKELLLKIIKSDCFKSLCSSNGQNENTVVFYEQKNDLNEVLQDNVHFSTDSPNTVNTTDNENKSEIDLTKSSTNAMVDKNLVINILPNEKIIMLNNKDLTLNENYANERAIVLENQIYENKALSSDNLKPLKSVENEINNENLCEKDSNFTEINDQNRSNNRNNFRRTSNYRQKNSAGYRFQQNDNGNFRNNRLNSNIQQQADRSNRSNYRRNEDNNTKNYISNGSIEKNRNGNLLDEKSSFRNNFRRNHRLQNNVGNSRRESHIHSNSRNNSNNGTSLEENYNKEIKTYRNLQQRNIHETINNDEKKVRYKRSNECGFIFAH